MKNENWVKAEDNAYFKNQAHKLVEDRKRWERQQLKEGKKEVLIPHPTIPRTFIVKYE